MLIRYWFNSSIYITTWRYGLEFDVQRNFQPTRFGYSYTGHLWAWDYRYPFTVTRLD